jgi:alkanesulfonate monooxygenase SsuD/methylene tetrahydromethanopterin reductase-like flavin-dependent oxidoreductase (luciferase family)
MRLNLFAMPTIPADMEERAAERPVGRSRSRYQMMIEEVRNLAVMADEMGVDAFSTTEHHFHTEGVETMPNPVALSIDLAARTKNLMLVPFSIVLTAANPIRVAEDMALLDNFSNGRAGVAFARGYQKRWMQVISQGGPVSGADRDADALNREIFEENLEIVLSAWTNDAFSYEGKHFKVPYPYEGIPGCGGLKWVRAYGAEGELDDDGVVRKVGTVPGPFQDPHPPIFLPLTSSPATIDFCARKGFTGFFFGSEPVQFRAACERFQNASEGYGHALKLGEHLGAVRSISVADNYEDAFNIAAQSTGYDFYHYLADFGFLEVFRIPSDDPTKPVTFNSEYEVLQRFIDLKYVLCGTPDQVKHDIAELRDVHGAGGDLEWLQWGFYQQGTLPFDIQRRQLEMFMEKVWPEFK